VADAFDAMTSNRPYHENKKGRPPAWAFGEVERQLGKQFCPTAGSAFISIREEIVRAMMELLPGTELDEPVAVTVDGFIPDPRG
jgi:HD-GYP domain-containing protein (c-di-GMP phosphodiesterase class II)